MADLNNNGIEDELEELSAEEALELGLINADGSLSQEEPVSPPTTIGESISQAYNESVLADVINRGFGQEVFQSKAPDGTPTYSIHNKRFGILGSQVPYSEASPESQLQANNFMMGSGGQERPLPETPTSPVLTPEQVQSILNEQRAAAEAAPDTPAIVSPSLGEQEQVQTIQQGAPDSPQANFAARMSTGEALTPQEVQDAQAFAASMGTTFDPATGYSREAFENAQPPTPSQFMRYEDSPGQRTEQFVDEQGRMRFRPTQEALQLQGQGAVTQPPVDALSSFEQDSLARQQRTGGTGSFEGDSLARQERIGGTGSFEGDSAAREARLRAEERQPGETQTQRDTRVAKSRTTGGQTQGLSFDDARRRAKGQLAARGIDDANSSLVNNLARGIQAEEPERLANLETERAINESRLIESKSKMNFEPRLIDVGGERAMELSPGYFQRISKDKPNKTGLQTTLGNLQDDLKSGRLTKEQHDIAVGNAKNIYIGLKEPKQNEIDVANKVAKLQGEAMGATPIEGTNTGDMQSFATEAEAKASGVKGEVLIGGRKAIID